MNNRKTPEKVSAKLLEPVFFTHRDLCWKIVRRDTAEFLACTIEYFAASLVTRGRSLFWSFPDEEALRYRAALRRLRRSGLHVKQGRAAQLPLLDLVSAADRERRPPALHPARRWNRRWDGTWWVLCYDVPEDRCDYRNRLRFFIRRLGMGRLQDSVFITPDDVRADYRDLTEAASATAVSVLFASRTVLGRADGDLSRTAWNMERLERRQSAFIETAAAIRKEASAGRLDAKTLRAVREEAFCVYLDVMRADPLLPRAAWPRGYAGEKAFAAHEALQRELLRALSAVTAR